MLKQSKLTPLSLLLVLAFLVGLFTLTDFGESWDEWQFYKYADRARESYGTWFQRGEVKVTGNTYDNYGPAFVIAAQQIARGLHALQPAWLVSDLRHLVVFIGFLAGAAAFHFIARRWLKPVSAFAATALYLTQPLLWGHAFISPKDIPFLSLVLISVALGLRMIDSKLILQGRPPFWLSVLTGAWLLSLVFLFVTPYIHENFLAEIIRQASADPAQPLGGMIRSIAQDFDQVSPQVYVTKMRVALIDIRLIYLISSAMLVGCLYRKHYPAAFVLFTPSLGLAALVLGLASSTRILGPLAGLVVAYLAFRVMGRKAFPILAVYAALAFMIMLASWPYLWPDPPARIQESLDVMSTYPWEGSVLFDGVKYLSTELPSDYLPVLLAIQFSEPVWLFCIPGIFMLRKNMDVLIITLMWFAAPLVALIVMHAPLYDNTRQIFFILPPLFLVAGLGIEWLLDLRLPWKRLAEDELWRHFVQAACIVLILLPGLLSGIRLHPYEYVYYNSLAGDPTGRYELEYWATSYRETTNWLNTNAKANSHIVVGVPSHLADIYLREDLKSIPIGDYLDKPVDYDFAMLSTRYDNHEAFFLEDEVVHRVERLGMLFAVVKQHGR